MPLPALEGLKNMFEALDVNRDGTITVDEIKREIGRNKVTATQSGFPNSLYGLYLLS